MSKHTIIGVLVLMSISLLGVVGLQLYWINDAIKVKQEQFDRSVNAALTKVVEKLETHEAVSVVAGQMAAMNNPRPVPQDTVPPPAPPTVESPLQESLKRMGPTARRTKAQPAPQPEKPQATIILSPTQEEKPAAQRFFFRDAVASHKAGPANDGHEVPRGNGSIRLDRASPLSGGKILIDKNKTLEAVMAAVATSSPRPYLHVREGFPDSARLKNLVRGSVYSIDTSFLKGKAQAFRKLSDSASFIIRTHNSKPISISVDTLRHFAEELDNLKQLKKLPVTFKPAAVSSIEVRNDSIIIFHKDTARQTHFRRQAVARPGNRANTTTIWSEAKPLRKATPLKGAITLGEARVAKPTKVTSEGKTTTTAMVKPAKLPNARTNASSIEKIEIRKDKLNDVVQKMVVEYAVKDEPLQERLNLQSLQPLLKTELQQQGILLDFGYWVVSGQTDTVAARNVEAIRNKALHSYRATLFPNDIFDKPDYIGLYFPDSKTYALKSLWGMLSLSVLFTLVIIATFGTTIHIIYKQKKLSEMKNDFINNMTHEFKTPIATISLASDAITNPKVYQNPDKIKYYTGIIREENKRMNTQVENVLQIALLEKNEFKMNLQPVDVHALIIRAIESIRLQVEQRLGQVNVQLDALQHELPSDEVHLYNVICNLLDNANKYSPASPDIQLVTKNMNGGIVIAVEDKGIGMSKDTQQRVFEKFYRVPTGNLHNVKGFGLGLSYVKAIIQAHRGDINLRSELGKGSRFEIFLPIN